MNRFIALFFVPFFLVADPLPHCKENDFMMVSLPSSGSTFLARMIRKSQPNLKMKYEFFNCLVHKSNVITLMNKPVINALEYCFETLPQSYLENYYQEWNTLNYHITKEVYSFFFTPFFNNRFILFGLYRPRNLTFPTGNEHSFRSFYQSFIKSKTLHNHVLEKIQNWLKRKNISDIEQQCAGHILGNYTILHYATIFNFPVINYQSLIELNEIELTNYLKTCIPPQLYTTNLIYEIITEREQDPKFLEKRKERYNKLNIEPFCQELITFMKSLDPDMPYWYLLE